MKMSDKNNGTVVLVAGVLLTLAGIGLVGKFAYDVVDAIVSEPWPTVEGTVLKSRVGFIDRGIGKVDDFVGNVEYEYEVGGQSYTNTFEFERQLTEHLAERDIADYPEGEVVEVYYNPSAPQESVLQLELTLNLYVALCGAIMILSGFFVARYCRRSREGGPTRRLESD
jgi:hypothetical protein